MIGRAHIVVQFVLLAAIALASGRASAQQRGRWWESPQAPPDGGVAHPTTPNQGGGGGDDGGGDRGGGEAAPPGRTPQELDPDAFGDPQGQSLQDPTAAPVLGGLDTTWRWQQILSSPRIGSKLTAVAVDPRNPQRIFVGTEEGTIVRSQDGGVTWRELELGPFVTTRRAFAIQTPGLPRLGETSIGSLVLQAFPPYQGVPINYPRLTLVSQAQFRTLPGFIGLVFPSQGAPGVTLLDDAVRGRPTVPVTRIAVCTGGDFSLLVATRTEVLGSNDGGLTYVRLLRMPGSVRVKQVTCSTRNPNHVLVSTTFGLFISNDGGVTFDPDLSGRPGNAADGVAFGPSPEGGDERVYYSSGDSLYAGDPDSDVGLEYVYPDFDNSATAPWGDIYWVETTADGEVWLATQDGIRLSRDYGRSFTVPDRSLFERQEAWQVLVGANERGGRRVAVLVQECTRRNQCTKGIVYASDDGGENWFPYFQAATRRTLEQMAVAPAAPGVPPRWWVVTGGELWATMPSNGQVPEAVDRESQLWARRALRRTPDMDRVIDEVLVGVELDRDRVNGIMDSLKNRNLIPRIQVLFDLRDRRFARVEDQSINAALTFDESYQRTDWRLYAWAEWSLRDVPIVSEEYQSRQSLYELRRQIAFIAEDAWHERALLLRRIAAGMSDRLQVEILKERIAALEAVLETWLGRSITSLPPGGMRIRGGVE